MLGDQDHTTLKHQEEQQKQSRRKFLFGEGLIFSAIGVLVTVLGFWFNQMNQYHSQKQQQEQNRLAQCSGFLRPASECGCKLKADGLLVDGIPFNKEVIDVKAGERTLLQIKDAPPPVYQQNYTWKLRSSSEVLQQTNVPWYLIPPQNNFQDHISSTLSNLVEGEYRVEVEVAATGCELPITVTAKIHLRTSPSTLLPLSEPNRSSQLPLVNPQTQASLSTPIPSQAIDIVKTYLNSIKTGDYDSAFTMVNQAPFTTYFNNGEREKQLTFEEFRAVFVKRTVYGLKSCYYDYDEGSMNILSSFKNRLIEGVIVPIKYRWVCKHPVIPNVRPEPYITSDPPSGSYLYTTQMALIIDKRSNGWQIYQQCHETAGNNKSCGDIDFHYYGD